MLFRLSHLEALADKLPARLARWAPQFAASEICYGVDAFAMAAIIDRESLGGDALKPPGPTGTGDHGNGHGLGQIDGRFHHRFIAAEFDTGTRLWADPTFNVLYGARLLARNLLGCDADYPTAIAAYNCGLTKAKRVVHNIGPGAGIASRVIALDNVTTGKDYVSDILRRRAQFTDAPLEGM